MLNGSVVGRSVVVELLPAWPLAAHLVARGAAVADANASAAATVLVVVAHTARTPVAVAALSFLVTLVVLFLLCRAFLRCQGRAQARLYASDRGAVEALCRTSARARAATSAAWMAGLQQLERTCPQMSAHLAHHAYTRVPCRDTGTHAVPGYYE